MAQLPRGSAQRLHGYRYVLSSIIKALPTFGPLLSEVKQEYEVAIHALNRNAAKLPEEWTAPKPPIHPLQLPAHFYAQELRRTQELLAHERKQSAAWRELALATRVQRSAAGQRLQRAGYGIRAALAEPDAQPPAPAAAAPPPVEPTPLHVSARDARHAAALLDPSLDSVAMLTGLEGGARPHAQKLPLGAAAAVSYGKADEHLRPLSLEVSDRWLAIAAEQMRIREQEDELARARAQSRAEAHDFELQLAVLERRAEAAGERVEQLRQGALFARHMTDDMLMHLDESGKKLAAAADGAEVALKQGQDAEWLLRALAECQKSLAEAEEERVNNLQGLRTLYKTVRFQHLELLRTEKLLTSGPWRGGLEQVEAILADAPSEPPGEA